MVCRPVRVAARALLVVLLVMLRPRKRIRVLGLVCQDVVDGHLPGQVRGSRRGDEGREEVFVLDLPGGGVGFRGTSAPGRILLELAEERVEGVVGLWARWRRWSGAEGLEELDPGETDVRDVEARSAGEGRVVLRRSTSKGKSVSFTV